MLVKILDFGQVCIVDMYIAVKYFTIPMCDVFFIDLAVVVV